MAPQLTWTEMSDTFAVVWSVSFLSALAAAALGRRRPQLANASWALLAGMFFAYLFVFGALFSVFGFLQKLKSSAQISPELCYFTMLMAFLLSVAPSMLDHFGKIALRRGEHRGLSGDG